MTDHNARDDRQAILPQLEYDLPIDAIEWLTRVFGFVEETRMSGPNGELYISVVRAPGGGIVMVAGPMRDDHKALMRSCITQVAEEIGANRSTIRRAFLASGVAIRPRYGWSYG